MTLYKPDCVSNYCELELCKACMPTLQGYFVMKIRNLQPKERCIRNSTYGTIHTHTHTRAARGYLKQEGHSVSGWGHLIPWYTPVSLLTDLLKC